MKQKNESNETDARIEMEELEKVNGGGAPSKRCVTYL